ncbi:MAG: GNAT family N-acetyltransferase, partial [Edaphobacter sp.]
IESQLLLYDAGSVDAIFRQAGFHLHPRLFMEYNFVATAPNEDRPELNLPPNIELRGWSAEHYQPAAELIHDAYTGHIDALINDQYCTLHGSLRFLHNIVRFPGCGIFDASNSWVLREAGTEVLVGVVLCSRVAEEVAHITQLCVARSWHGHHLGRMLLTHCMGHLAQSGFKAITLTVTEANRQAVNLYEDLGFHTRHRFDAMVFNKTQAASDF